MKLTTTPGDTNYWRNFYLVSPEIWVDSIQLHSVIEADDIEGYAIQPKFDDGFKIMHADGEIITVRREGKVSFIGGQRRGQP